MKLEVPVTAPAFAKTSQMPDSNRESRGRELFLRPSVTRSAGNARRNI